jgi:uncharacterized protein involved in response to NO
MLKITEPRAAPNGLREGTALWRLGFRPFYLCASVFAAVSVVLWASEFAGWLPFGYARSPIWHAHEMLFGYTLAVVAGFLLTAVRNWTGQPTASGGTLAALVVLWLAGRLAVATPLPVASAVVNALFPLAIAVAIAVPLRRSGNRRNYFFVALLLLLGITQASVHATYIGLADWRTSAALKVGIDIVLFVIAVMGGRVIPMFTNNGVPGAGAARDSSIEQAALGSALALLVADLAQVPEPLALAVAAFAALAHLRRWWLWRPLATIHTPLVWVLHAAYGWIVVHLVLRILAAFEVVPESLALHAFTMGAIGGMTIGMMTRTARGHTGLPLVAGASETAMFVLVNLATLVRVAGGALAPERAYVPSIAVAATCWSAAFALYAIRYAPVLVRPRADGKPG